MDTSLFTSGTQQRRVEGPVEKWTTRPDQISREMSSALHEIKVDHVMGNLSLKSLLRLYCKGARETGLKFTGDCPQGYHQVLKDALQADV